MSRHWSIDQLTDHLYGIREADSHLESCRECNLRLAEIEQRRAVAAAAPDTSPAQLAAQRQAVLARIQSPSRNLLRWVPAAAAACLLAVALVAHRPAPVTPQNADSAVSTSSASNDAQLFADIYNVEESDEPRAAAPIHALFQEGQP